MPSANSPAFTFAIAIQSALSPRKILRRNASLLHAGPSVERESASFSAFCDDAPARFPDARIDTCDRQETMRPPVSGRDPWQFSPASQPPPSAIYNSRWHSRRNNPGPLDDGGNFSRISIVVSGRR